MLYATSYNILTNTVQDIEPRSCSSFSEHVMGGRKFLMRYYSSGDEIYFIGFSRGSYISRFLSEILDCIYTFCGHVLQACLCSPDTVLYINRGSSIGPLHSQ